MVVRTGPQGAVRSRASRWAVGAAIALTAGSALLSTAVVAGTAGAAAAPTTVTVSHNKTWGTILTLRNGDTVYRSTADPTNKSICTGRCAVVWPPVLLAAGQKRPVGHGVTGLGAITRAGGARQVTYKGVPLYLFEGDHRAGQATGNIKDTWGQWWVVNPSNPRGTPTAATSSGQGSPTTSVGSGVAY